MGELIGAISKLCKLVECLISTSLKPDFFRLSKLNKLGPDQMQRLLDATHRLCCFSANNEPCFCDPLKCVQNYLRKQGGVADYLLTHDFSARQLLLSFGFILSGKIIECNIDSVLMASPLGEELPSLMVEPVSDTLDEALARPDGDDTQAMLGYVLFASGRIKQNIRAIANFSEEKAQLFTKVHQATSSVRGSHLSVGDLLMTLQPELQSEFLLKCQHCIPLLQAYFKWHHKRHIFWEWMMTVVEEEFKQRLDQHSIAEITHLHKFLRKIKSDVQESQLNVGENSYGDFRSSEDKPVTVRRMCFGNSGNVLDSLIENMNLKIKTLEMGNENLIKKINADLLKGNKKKHAVLIASIVKSFSDMTI